MNKFKPTRISSKRMCDFYQCNASDNLIDYHNDMGYDLKYCNSHHRSPYGIVAECVPIFKKDNYLIKNSKGDCLCEYTGCHESNNLISLYSARWCNNHGRIITSLRLTSLGKSSKEILLINKIKEFSYRDRRAHV